jgi:alkylation response protein AidB-like acyl-CoA dehydrogenase
MDFNYSEEQDMLRTMARDFLTDKVPKTLVKELEEDEKGYSPDLWNEMVELGWMGLLIPDEYGGSGMTFLDLSVVLEEIGRACLPGPYFSTVVLGGIPILKYGTPEQKQEYLGKIAGGEAVCTFAITEESGLYDPESIHVTAKAAGDAYTINGTKLFVPDANVADYMLCAARTGEGITVFIVDAKSAGITVNPLKTIAGDKLCEVVFDNVSVPKDNVLGEPGKGWDIVRKTLEYAAVGKCCVMIGAMQQSLDMTVDYAKERNQYGHPIGSFQVVQHYCSNMAIDVDGTRFSTYEAAWKLNEDLPAAKEVAIAKSWANEAFERVSTLAHQIHGAIGCTIDHDLHYYTRTGKAAALSYGSSDYCREIVATEMGL